MGERIINPNLNVLEKHKTMNLINPYRFGSVPSLPATPWGYYPFDETTGTLAYTDNTDKPFTISNASMWDVSGHKNGCLALGNASFYGHLDLTNTDDLFTNSEITFCFWYKTGSGQMFIGKGFGGGSRVLNFKVDGGKYRVLVGNASGNWTYTTTTGINVVQTNTWTHIALVLTTSGFTLYEDGVLIWTAVYSFANFKLDANTFYVGSPNIGGNMDMDELVVYDRSLTPSEIIQVMDNT